jgi:capsular polysaccharide biosynthesis protein
LEAEQGLGLPAEAAEYEYNILSLQDFLQVIRSRFWVVALVTVVLVGAAVGLSLVQTPMYEASIKILVGQERASTENPNANDVMGLQQLTRTMAEGVNSRPVAEVVIQQLNLQMTPEDFLANLSVEQIPETQFMEVNYRDSSPDRAQRVADTIGDAFSTQVSQVSPSASAITATVWERAETPDGPVSPNPARNGLLALMLGLMLGTVLAFLLEYLDDSWRSPEEAEQVSGVPTFGLIPEFGAITDKKKGRY